MLMIAATQSLLSTPLNAFRKPLLKIRFAIAWIVQQNEMKNKASSRRDNNNSNNSNKVHEWTVWIDWPSNFNCHLYLFSSSCYECCLLSSRFWCCCLFDRETIAKYSTAIINDNMKWREKRMEFFLSICWIKSVGVHTWCWCIYVIWSCYMRWFLSLFLPHWPVSREQKTFTLLFVSIVCPPCIQTQLQMHIHMHCIALR